MEWCPADEESDHDSNYKEKRRAIFEVKREKILLNSKSAGQIPVRSSEDSGPKNMLSFVADRYMLSSQDLDEG